MQAAYNCLKLWLGEIWYLFWLLGILAHTRYTYKHSDTSTYTCKKTFFKNGKIFSNFNQLNRHTQYQKIKQDNHIYRTCQEGVKVNWGCKGGPFLGMTSVPPCRKRLGQKHQRRWHEDKTRRKNPEEPGSADLWPETPHLYNRRNKCLSFQPFSGASCYSSPRKLTQIPSPCWGLRSGLGNVPFRKSEVEQQKGVGGTVRTHLATSGSNLTSRSILFVTSPYPFSPLIADIGS